MTDTLHALAIMAIYTAAILAIGVAAHLGIKRADRR